MPRVFEPGISILICTYNGVKKLTPTLEALGALQVDGIPGVELIVVDNNSSDGTSELVKRKWEKLATPFPLVSISEPTPGKLLAQEKGLSMVTYEHVVICDDDNSLFPDYLQVGWKLMNENPTIGVLGGQGIAVSEVELPNWFNEFAYNFACAPQAAKTGEVRPTRNVVYGAGMWLRMQGYADAKENGFSFILSSRTGKSLSTGGEDSELCWALRFLGYEIWYVDEMKFHHHIPPERLTEDYRKKLLKGMLANGPLGRIYLRVGNGEIKKPVRAFWLKELIYTLAYFVTLPFQTNVNDKGTETYRVWNNVKHFIRLRSEYDQKINDLLHYKQRCQSSPTFQS